MAKILDIDRGWGKIIKNMRELASKEVRVGVQGEAGNEKSGVNLVDVAVYNEFGTENIPARPFMSKSFDNSQRRVENLMKNEAGRLIEGRQNAEQVLKKSGLFLEGQAKKYVASPVWVPNAPSTIAKKGSSQPLIDSGLMRQSIRYEVKNKQ